MTTTKAISKIERAIFRQVKKLNELADRNPEDSELSGVAIGIGLAWCDLQKVEKQRSEQELISQEYGRVYWEIFVPVCQSSEFPRSITRTARRRIEQWRDLEYRSFNERTDDQDRAVSEFAFEMEVFRENQEVLA